LAGEFKIKQHIKKKGWYCMEEPISKSRSYGSAALRDAIFG